jgi:hypothetical protein
MPWVGFEPTILVLERAKIVHDLDRAGTVIGCGSDMLMLYSECPFMQHIICYTWMYQNI